MRLWRRAHHSSWAWRHAPWTLTAGVLVVIVLVAAPDWPLGTPRRMTLAADTTAEAAFSHRAPIPLPAEPLPRPARHGKKHGVLYSVPGRTTAPPGAMRVLIPAIRVVSPLVPLGLNPDGTLQVPANYSLAGWYAGGPKPGDPGPAVIAGHVSSADGPAVFYRLDSLRPGDSIYVDRGGLQAHFVVQKVGEYSKHHFPTDLVYGNVSGAALRLITCGGAFDSSTGHFVDNVVVFARLVSLT